MKSEEYRRLLLERREALQSLAQTGRDAAGTVELDQSKVGRLSRMDALEAQAISQERERRRESWIYAVSRRPYNASTATISVTARSATRRSPRRDCGSNRR